MNILAVILVFLVALGVSLMSGPVIAFMIVYLPVLLVLGEVDQMELPKIPDASVPVAALYGVMLGWLIDFRMIRVIALDYVVLAIVAVVAFSAAINQEIWTGVSWTGEFFLQWTAPYLFARIAFTDERARETALKFIPPLAVFIGIIALIEFRLWPGFGRNNLGSIGLVNAYDMGTGSRFGFFRVRGFSHHPIYFGNTMLILTGMLLVLIGTTRAAGVRPIQWLGTLAAFCCAVASLSFGPYTGIMAAVCIYFVMTRRWLPQIPLPLIVLGIYALFVTMHSYLMTVDTTYIENLPPLVESIRTRGEIAQASSAFLKNHGGFVGVGPFFSEAQEEELGLESLDNTYLLYTIQYGWIWLALWLSIPLLLTWRAQGVFWKIRETQAGRMLALGLSVVLGVMVAMYNVWPDPFYTTIWMVMLGFTATMIEVLRDRQKEPPPSVGRGSHAAAAPARPRTTPPGLVTTRPNPRPAPPREGRGPREQPKLRPGVMA